MNIKDLSKPLQANEIDFRIQSINKGGYATILAYKNARADQQRLDEAVGELNWQRHHSRDNHNCIVSIWDEDKSQWIEKEDTGTESNTEKEKGLASDSFKRACFNWGIGRELYAYPVIQIKLNGTGKNQKEEWYIDDKGYPKSGWGLKLKEWLWSSSFIDGELIYLSSVDEKGVSRYVYGKSPRNPEDDDSNAASKAPKQAAPVEMITSDQATEISDLIIQAKANAAKLFAYYKCTSLDDMPKSIYHRVKGDLEKKIDDNSKGEKK